VLDHIEEPTWAGCREQHQAAVREAGGETFFAGNGSTDSLRKRITELESENRQLKSTVLKSMPAYFLHFNNQDSAVSMLTELC